MFLVWIIHTIPYYRILYYNDVSLYYLYSIILFNGEYFICSRHDGVVMVNLGKETNMRTYRTLPRLQKGIRE